MHGRSQQGLRWVWVGHHRNHLAQVVANTRMGVFRRKDRADNLLGRLLCEVRRIAISSPGQESGPLKSSWAMRRKLAMVRSTLIEETPLALHGVGQRVRRVQIFQEFAAWQKHHVCWIALQVEEAPHHPRVEQPVRRGVIDDGKQVPVAVLSRVPPRTASEQPELLRVIDDANALKQRSDRVGDDGCCCDFDGHASMISTAARSTPGRRWRRSLARAGASTGCRWHGWYFPMLPAAEAHAHDVAARSAAPPTQAPQALCRVAQCRSSPLFYSGRTDRRG